MKRVQETPARRVVSSAGTRAASRSTLRAMLVCLAAGLTLGCAARYKAGARPWIEKPSEQWTQADAQQILTNSPWAVRTAHTVGGRAGSFSFGGCGLADPMDSRTEQCYPGHFDPGESGREIVFIAVWQSADTTCRASQVLARRKEPRPLPQPRPRLLVPGLVAAGVLTLVSRVQEMTTTQDPVAPLQPAGKVMCDSPFQYHRFWLRGTGLYWSKPRIDRQKSISTSTLVRGFPEEWRGGPDTGELLRRSLLRIGKIKLNPSEVRQPGHGELVLDFPAYSPDGKPTIPPTATTVQLFTFVGKKKIKVTFDLRKMVTAKGRDL